MTKKILNTLLIVVLLMPGVSSAKYAPHSEGESAYDYISHEVYCFFTDCFISEKTENIIVNNTYNKKTSTQVEDRLFEKKDKKIVVKNKITNNKVKYINNGNTVVKKYYNTIERQPIINNTYPKEIVEKRIVEEFNDSSIKRQIRSNRSMISQLAGMSNEDNLANNVLNDLGDVNVDTPNNGEVLVWDTVTSK